jgi:DNA-binding winged helix-turn-helix (wHTH) protein/TolB-like protein
MQKTAHQTYSFGEFTLNLSRGALYRGDQELKLRLKSFEVLKYLTENSGRLVSKDELIDFVWRGIAVTDDSLVQCLKDIRNALDDRSQEYIKTVPRRGYIFEKEVEENGAGLYVEETAGVHLVIEESEEINGNGSPIPVSEKQGTVRAILGAAKRHKIVATITMFVAVTVTVIGGVMASKPVLAWYFKPPSIAVLPILNATGDAGRDYISDGLTESIIRSLIRLNEGGKTIPRLRVIALSTVLIFKGKEIEPQSVGRSLGVDTVVSSKMSEEDGQRTFKFEMIDVADGSVRWSRQYTVSLAPLNRGIEILDKQNEIPKDIAAQLPLSLSDADRQNLTRRYTQNAEAYDAFLKGRAAFRRLTPSSIRSSIDFFQRAIDLDPNFALAYWGMGLSYWGEGKTDERPDKEANEKAVDMYRRALAIDNTLTAAADGIKQIDADIWNWEAIEKAGPTHPGYDTYLSAMGRVGEAVEVQQSRLAIAPYNPVLNLNHCNTFNLAHRYPEAIFQCRKTLNLVPVADKTYVGPESPWVHLLLANALAESGSFAEAITEAEMAIKFAEDSEAMLAVLGSIYAKAGQRDEAIKILDLLRERMDRGEYVPAFNMAFIYTGLGDKDQAFLWLDKAFDERETKLEFLKVEPIFDPLRSDARFAQLIRRVGLPD